MENVSDYYEEEEEAEEEVRAVDVDENSSHRMDGGFFFKPAKLLFDHSPTCIPSIAQFEVHNLFQWSIDIYAIQSRDPQFHPILFQPQSIPPENGLVIQVLFLPNFMDLVPGELLIETSEGVFSYKLEGRAVANPYRLHPFLANKVMLTSSESLQIPVRMFNPHSSTLHIMEIFTTEDFISLSEVPRGQASASVSNSKEGNSSIDMTWSIAPGKEEVVMVLGISPMKPQQQQPGFKRGFVHIRTDHDKMIVPVEVEFVPGGIRLLDPALDFGIIRSLEERKTLDINIANDGSESVKILDISIEGNGQGLAVVFNEELMIYADRPYTKVAVAYFQAKSMKMGPQGGFIVISTNCSNTAGAILRIPFNAIILQGGLGYDSHNAIYFINPPAMLQLMGKTSLSDLTDPSVCMGQKQEINFQNHYPTSIIIYTVQVQTCPDLIQLINLPESREIGTMRTWGPLKVHFCMDKILYHYALEDDFVPKTCWLEVQSNISNIRFPVYITDGRLEVDLIDAVRIHSVIASLLSSQPLLVD